MPGACKPISGKGRRRNKVFGGRECILPQPSDGGESLPSRSKCALQPLVLVDSCVAIQVQLDVTNSDSIREAAQKVAREHKSIFALVNNAGVGLDLPWCSRPLPVSVASETLR